VVVVHVFQEGLDFGSSLKPFLADAPGHSSWSAKDTSHQSMTEFPVLLREIER
jgi:hypothetical protein